MNFTAVAAIAVHFRFLLKRLAVRPLVMLGQASLPVFCVHLFCVFVALTIMGNNPMLTGWPAAVMTVASFTALLLTAIVANRRALKAAGNSVAPLVTLPQAKPQG